MEEAQVGNADINSAPESFISDDSSDFFADLDRSVNGGIISGTVCTEGISSFSVSVLFLKVMTPL